MTLASPTEAGVVPRSDRGGLGLDLGLYAGSTLFAGLTAAFATMAPHAIWGRIAVIGYAAATVATAGALAARHRIPPRALLAGRAAVAGLTAAATCLLPLLVLAIQRAGGRTERAQDEVVTIEGGGYRLLHSGMPYLTRYAIAALPPDARLRGYLPYQPGMSLFGLPRAAFGVAWWTDARVWFAAITAITVGCALFLVRRAGSAALVRCVQAVAVLPLCTLALAVGGDDLPVLGLCLLALALAYRDRMGSSGIAVGVAGALKLFAWPVAIVLLALAVRRGGSAAWRYAAGAFGLPVLALVPALLNNRDAVLENVVRFPLGRGLVASPAASPFPGHLIANGLPGGHAIAAVLLVVAAAGLGVWLIRRPPADARTAAAICAVGLTVGIILLPATRFGYLLYPAGYAVWAAALPITVEDG